MGKLDFSSTGRLPHGRRGLKFLIVIKAHLNQKSRLPHGRRGLKFHTLFAAFEVLQSPSSRKAGIEIENPSVVNLVKWVAFLTEGETENRLIWWVFLGSLVAFLTEGGD